MRTFLLTVFLSAISTLPVAAAPEAVPTAQQVRSAAQRSLAFLEEEGIRWKESRKCASCHHAPMMIWALNEAKGNGYAINEKALAEVTTWVIAPDDPAKVFPKPPPPNPKAPPAPAGKRVNQAAFRLAAGIGASRLLDAPTKAGLDRLVKLVLEQQEADGTWNEA